MTAGEPRRRTKIVATVGPASADRGTLTAMALAGMDVARVTLAHGTTAEAVDRIRLLRDVVPGVGVLVDLPGPKIRAGAFPAGGVTLIADTEVVLAGSGTDEASTSTRIAVSNESLIEDLQVGDRVALGDGGVALIVSGRRREGAVAHVRSGGLLQGRRG